MNPSVAEDHGEQDQLLGGPNGAPHTTTTTNGHRPGLYKRFKQAAKKLKHEVLALYYALQDPRTGLLPRILGVLVLAYALSPFDLIPDFIPVLGLLDDLLLLPGMIWLAIKLIPAEVMESSRERAEREPLRLHQNWVAALFIFALWDALLLWLVYLACSKLGSGKLHPWRWWAVGVATAVLLTAELGWSIFQVRREARRMEALPGTTPVAVSSQAGATFVVEQEGSLEEGLLRGEQ